MDSSDELIAATFKILSHFTKMRHLSCSFDPFFVIDLSRLGLELLPGLDQLTIRSGSIYCPRTPPLLKIRVKHFAFHASRFYEPKADDRRGSFLYALDPQTLCSLAVNFPRFARSEWLIEATDVLHTFHDLHSLSITCPFLARMRNHGLIGRFPSLRNLTITGKSVGQHSVLTTPLCPLLGHFTGPCAYLSLVLPGTPCTHLTLHPCLPDELLHSLQRVGDAPSITTLTLLLTHAQLSAWTAAHNVFDRLPAVADLQLNIIADVNVDSTGKQICTTEVRTKGSIFS
jgi:hypothetical protein